MPSTYDKVNSHLDSYMGEGNPWHDPDTGELTDPETLTDKGSGSYSMGKETTQVTGGSDGNPRLSATKRPCGRNARELGWNIRCHDGEIIRGPEDSSERMDALDKLRGDD